MPIVALGVVITSWTVVSALLKSMLGSGIVRCRAAKYQQIPDADHFFTCRPRLWYSSIISLIHGAQMCNARLMLRSLSCRNRIGIIICNAAGVVMLYTFVLDSNIAKLEGVA